MNAQDAARKIEALEATQTGLLILITALMQSTPDQTGMHLRLTSLLEQQLGASGSLGALLNERQKHHVRELVERLGCLGSASAAWQPPQAPRQR